MKNQFVKLLILVLLSFSVVLVGCKKSEVVNNNFTFDGHEYILTNGFIDNWGATDHNPLTYEFGIVLTTNGISFNSTDSLYKGTGSYILMTLYSSDRSTLIPGTYTFDAFSSTDSSTMGYAMVGINNNIDSEADSSNYLIKTGIVEVSKRGSVYTLGIELYPYNNKAVNGYYSGLLKEHNFSAKK